MTGVLQDLSTLNWVSLIQAHGYWVLALGCLIEGETVLVLAGVAAHQGYLNPMAVLGIAATAGFVGDQCFFWLGRRHGALITSRWPAIGRQTDRVFGLIDKYRAAVVIGVRFAYGLRVAGPVIIGMSAFPWGRFCVLNAVGATLWACLVAGFGWALGDAAQAVLGELVRIEHWLVLAIVAAALAVLWHFLPWLKNLGKK